MKKREKNTKKPKPSTLESLESKVLLPYKEAQWGDNAQMTAKFKDRLRQDYYEWSLLPSSIDIAEFANQYGMSFRYFKLVANKDPIFKETHEVVKDRIGVRLQKLAMIKKLGYDPATIHKTLHNYHPVWRDTIESEREFRKELQEKESNMLEKMYKGQSFNVPSLDEDIDNESTDRNTTQTKKV